MYEDIYHYIYTFLCECHTACVDAPNLNRVCMRIDMYVYVRHSYP